MLQEDFSHLGFPISPTISPRGNEGFGEDTRPQQTLKKPSSRAFPALFETAVSAVDLDPSSPVMQSSFAAPPGLPDSGMAPHMYFGMGMGLDMHTPPYFGPIQDMVFPESQPSTGGDMYSFASCPYAFNSGQEVFTSLDDSQPIVHDISFTENMQRLSGSTVDDLQWPPLTSRPSRVYSLPSKPTHASWKDLQTETTSRATRRASFQTSTISQKPAQLRPASINRTGTIRAIRPGSARFPPGMAPRVPEPTPKLRGTSKLSTPYLLAMHEFVSPPPPSTINLYADVRLAVAQLCCARLRPLLELTKAYFHTYNASEACKWNGTPEDKIDARRREFKDEFLHHVRRFIEQIHAMEEFICLGIQHIGIERTKILLKGGELIRSFMHGMLETRPDLPLAADDMRQLYQMFVEFPQVLNTVLQIRWEFSQETLAPACASGTASVN